MTEKRFYKGIELKNNLLYFKGVDHMPNIIDIVVGYNTILEENEQLKSENDSYKNMFFEIVETALTDTNCRKLYCKGILDIFDKANSLNQAREMIKEHLK